MSRGGDVYCPHCYMLVESGVSGPWPAAHRRCPNCGLIIGPGRGRPSPDGNPGVRGAAAGVMAERARRASPTPTHSKDDVHVALARVAAEMGVRIDRLLMVDYQDRAAHDPSLPQLPEVLALYGGWKAARRDAAEKARASG
jgi:hypothetical protein